MAPDTAMPAAGESLRQIPYFAELSGPEIELVAGAAVERRFGKGEIVSLEGSACDGLYVVATGRVRVYKVSLDGREQVLLMAGQGETFNEVPVFDGGPNPATAQAMEPSVLWLLPANAMLRLASEHPAISRGIMRVLASHLRHLALLVEDLSFRHVRSRVAKILLSWLEDQAAGREAPRLTQQQIAALVGTAREVVARVMKGFEESGVLRTERGRIVAIERERLIDAI